MKKFTRILLGAAFALGCVASASAADLYMRGGMNNWLNDGLQDAYKFTDAGNGVYTLKVASLPANTDFKIADKDWKEQYGQGEESQVITVDKPYTVNNGNNPGNMKLGVNLSDATLTLNTQDLTLLVTAGGSQEAKDEVAVAGDFNGWNTTANSTTEMTNDCGTVVVNNWKNGNYGFKILVNGSWLSAGEGNETIANGQWYGLPGENPNMKLDASAEGKTVTFTIAIDKNFKAEWAAGDTPVDPDPVPGDKVFSLVGSMNGWDEVNAPDFKAEGNNVYTISVASLAADTEFKVVQDHDWKVASFGAEGDPAAPEASAIDVTVGTVMNAWQGSGNNFKVVEALTNVKITFTYVAEGPCTLLVEAGDTPVDPDPVPGDKVFSLVGSMNGWNEKTAPDFKAEGNDVYTYSVASLPADAEFKVCQDHAWKVSFGAEGDPAAPEATAIDVTVGTVMNAWQGSGCNFKVTEPLTDVKFTFTYVAEGPCTLLVEGKKASSAINAVEAAEAVEAVYYNLQGVRVANPVNGVFVKVAGNKAVKVAL